MAILAVLPNWLSLSKGYIERESRLTKIAKMAINWLGTPQERRNKQLKVR